MSVRESPTKHLTGPVFGATNGFTYQRKAVVCANACKIWRWMPPRGVCALLRWLIALGFIPNWANRNKRRAVVRAFVKFTDASYLVHNAVAQCANTRDFNIHAHAWFQIQLWFSKLTNTPWRARRNHITRQQFDNG